MPGFEPITTRPASSSARGTTVAPRPDASEAAVSPAAGSPFSLTAAIVSIVASWRSLKPAGATASAIGPPSIRSCAEVPSWTCPGVVRYSEPKTISSAPSRSARSRRPSGVEALITTKRGTSGSPSQRAPFSSSSSASLWARFSSSSSGSTAWRTYASAREPPARAITWPSASASVSFSVPS